MAARQYPAAPAESTAMSSGFTSTIDIHIKRLSYIADASRVAALIKRETGYPVTPEYILAWRKRRPPERTLHSGAQDKRDMGSTAPIMSASSAEQGSRSLLVALARFHIKRHSPNRKYWSEIIRTGGRAGHV